MSRVGWSGDDRLTRLHALGADPLLAGNVMLGSLAALVNDEVWDQALAIVEQVVA